MPGIITHFLSQLPYAPPQQNKQNKQNKTKQTNGNSGKEVDRMAKTQRENVDEFTVDRFVL